VEITGCGMLRLATITAMWTATVQFRVSAVSSTMKTYDQQTLLNFYKLFLERGLTAVGFGAVCGGAIWRVNALKAVHHSFLCTPSTQLHAPALVECK